MANPAAGNGPGIRTGIRIGIDTGGTFTDVVAVHTATGRRVSTKTPSTPDDPSTAFVRGLAAALALLAAGPDEVDSVRHGTTVATNQLLQGAVGSLGLITTDGYESILEIARQSVPEGYGNSASCRPTWCAPSVAGWISAAARSARSTRIPRWRR
jgi:N-methylhydantoinase A